jgi:fatty-acyl-CoA synthase
MREPRDLGFLTLPASALLHLSRVWAVSFVSRLTAGAIVLRSSTVAFERPDRLPLALVAMAPWGVSFPGGVAAAAARYPNRIAVVDEAGATTYRELWRRINADAKSLVAHGLGPGMRVGLLCRNHRGFVEWLAAVAATGADVVFLNTGFAGPQLGDVVASERIEVVIHDDEFTGVVAGCGARLVFDESAMGAMAEAGGRARPRSSQGSLIILTSGTTGRPKGAARRSDPGAIEGVAAVLERIPLRLGDTQVIAAPLFHAWGLTNLMLGISRCTTNVLARRFDPLATLHAVAEHHAEVFVVIPVMLARILALDPDVLAKESTPALRVIASSGSALGATLVTEALDHFGPVLYNLYGSTEVAVATIATPADLRKAPATAGRVARGVTVEILDRQARPVPAGTVGRVFVGGALRFEGYTNGGGKEVQHGLLSSGDLGYFDGDLLFVSGREDDMIVSGGENVFPAEVEELLSQLPSVAEVAVVGVPDDDFGQVLAAFIVKRRGVALTADEVRSHVRNSLARYKVPRHVKFLKELPRNETGKIVRRKLSISAVRRSERSRS